LPRAPRSQVRRSEVVSFVGQASQKVMIETGALAAHRSLSGERPLTEARAALEARLHAFARANRQLRVHWIKLRD
jgi:hypothetical protein